MHRGMWSEGPLLAFDLETTGRDPHEDLIVTASIVTITPQASGPPVVDCLRWLADPGVDIPADATAVHGISTATARAQGRPAPVVTAEVAAALGRLWLPEVPLCIYNAPYDLTLLDAELQRHLNRRLALSGPVIDPLGIDRTMQPHRPGPRRLPNVCEYYKVKLDQFHQSDQDAIAGARLAWKLARCYPDLAQMSLAELNRQQAQWHTEREHKFAAQLDIRAERQAAEGKQGLASATRERAASVRAAAHTWPLEGRRAGSGATGGARQQPVARPARAGGPRMSHASWSSDDELSLRTQWLACEPTRDAAAVVDELAERFGRSAGAIRSRLVKLHCHFRRPGMACTAQEADELKILIAAEYRTAAQDLQ